MQPTKHKQKENKQYMCQIMSQQKYIKGQQNGINKVRAMQ